MTADEAKELLIKALRDLLAAERCDDCWEIACDFSCECSCHKHESAAREQARKVLQQVEGKA